jgi:hypothetical protein
MKVPHYKIVGYPLSLGKYLKRFQVRDGIENEVFRHENKA